MARNARKNILPCEVPRSLVTETDAAGKNALLYLVGEAARPLEGQPDTENSPDPAELAKRPLAAGSDPSQTDFYGWNALHLAARFSTTGTIDVLVLLDAQPDLLHSNDAEEPFVPSH